MRDRIKNKVLEFKNRNKNVKIAPNACVAMNSDFEGYNRIGQYSFFCGHIGYASYIGDHCHINADVGRFTCIGPRVVVARGNHPTSDWVSVHPAFFSTEKQCGMTFTDKELFEEKKQRVRIGNDVWIGDSAILMDGITVGDGAVIAAGAVVTKDVEPYSVVGGVPAKIIRYRFEDRDIVKQLLQIKWWDRPIEWIRNNASKYHHVEEFLKDTEGGFD